MNRPTKTAQQLLESKRSAHSGVISVTPSDNVLSALMVMREKDIGAVVVLDAGKLSGILTERDYARKCELEGKAADKCLVHEIMTDRALVYASPEDPVELCRSLMAEHHVRHLPVYANGAVMGVLSLRDVLEEIIAEDTQAIRELDKNILLMTTDTGAY